MWVGGVRVIVFKDDKILMVRQHHEGRDIWMLPGGNIEENENSAQAAVREVKEETGLDIEILDTAWHVEEVSPERGQRFVNYMVGRITGGELKLGRDPEFADDNQVLRETRFLSKEEIGRVKYLYPDFLNEEIWDILTEKPKGLYRYTFKTKENMVI